MTDVPYIIAASRSRLVLMSAFSVIWISLLAQQVLFDRGRDQKIMIFASVVWLLAALSAFVNRTVFTETGVDQRMLLRGRRIVSYANIRTFQVAGSLGVKAAYIYTTDGRQIVIMGNEGQISCAESIVRSRISQS
jgi:hypothetical protein